MAQEHDSNRQRRLREWFMPSGLAECTSCGQRGLVRTVEGDGYCIDCGHVEGIDEAAVALQLQVADVDERSAIGTGAP